MKGQFSPVRHESNGSKGDSLLGNEKKTPLTYARIGAVNCAILFLAVVSLVLILRMTVQWNTLKQTPYPTKRLPTPARKPILKKHSTYPTSQWCQQHGLKITRQALQECRQCTKQIWDNVCADPTDSYCRDKILKEFGRHYQQNSPSYFELLQNYLSKTQRTFAHSEGGYKN